MGIVSSKPTITRKELEGVLNCLIKDELLYGVTVMKGTDREILLSEEAILSENALYEERIFLYINLTAPFKGIFCMNEGDGQRNSTL